MTERLQRMTDDQLGAALVRLGHASIWPTTPDLAAGVGETIRAQRAAPALVAPRLSMPSRRRTLLVIAAALLALAGVALGARLVIELGAIAVEVLPGRPTGLPTNVATGEDFGTRVSLADAEAIAGFPPALPAALGLPRSTWVDEAQVGVEPDDIAVRIVSEWLPSPELPIISGTNTGAVQMQFEGDWEVASKELSAETNRFGEAIVEGRDAFWTTGEHELVLVRRDDVVRLLVTGNVLIWQDAGFTFRLETALPKHEAVAIAESVQPAIDLG
jgi:hypothetical protein